MSSSAAAKKYASSTEGFKHLTRAWGHSVPRSVQSTTTALHGLQRLRRRHR